MEFVFPSSEKEGFKILKSGLSIKRTVRIFNQEIWFSKSKWNNENEICAFTPNFSVSIKGYDKWHKSQYGGNSANYIESWNPELFDDNDYDLAKDDNKRIVELLNQNIENVGIPYLTTLSKYDSAVEHLIESERYYLAPKMIDICIINEDLQAANNILIWFRNYERADESKFMESTLNDMNQRELKLKGV